MATPSILHSEKHIPKQHKEQIELISNWDAQENEEMKAPA
jgi:hypothetical protein